MSQAVEFVASTVGEAEFTTKKWIHGVSRQQAIGTLLGARVASVRHKRATMAVMAGLLACAAVASQAASAYSGQAAASEAAPPVTVKVTYPYNPNHPENPVTGRLVQLMKEDPGVSVEFWGGLMLPGGAGRAPLMMALAGRTAPDITESWFHIIRNDIQQGFLYPLNEWIGEDADGDGQISEAEAIWPRWKEIPLLWRQVVTINGKVYGLPHARRHFVGVIFRIDLVRAAGLDPNRPPKTWDEFIYWCQKLTDPNKKIPGAPVQRGQRAFAIAPYGWHFLPWLQSAGGEPIAQVRISPKTGQEYSFPPDATSFVTPDGEDLRNVESRWRADFASPAGLRAAELYHRLRWMKWMVDPETHEPINLTDEDIHRGYALVGDRKVPVAETDIIKGVARGYLGVARGFTEQRGQSPQELLQRGEIAMLTWSAEDLGAQGREWGINPDLLSWFPFPAAPGPGGRRVVQLHNHYVVLCEGVGARPKAERDKVWEVLAAMSDKGVVDNDIRQRVLAGLARFVNPADLKRLGLDDYLKDVPQAVREIYEGMADGSICVRTEPYMGFWVTQDEALSREVITLITAETGEHFDYVTALKETEHAANSGLMFGWPKEVLDTYRPYARIVFVLLVGVMVTFLVFIVRSFTKKEPALTKQVYSGWRPWLLVGPALVLIGLWSYYPLLRGMVMAFEDYRITGTSPFVGLDNFITLALDQSFWVSIGRTVYFVVLNMTLAFLTPILLALLLSEVPSGKILFRTLFFLPQVTSALVIALLWRLMYTRRRWGS